MIAAIWSKLFLASKPSLGLSFFRLFVGLTVGCHLLPTFFCLADNYFPQAFRVADLVFFPPFFVKMVQQSPEAVIVIMAGVFVVSWFFFLIGFYSQRSCLIMTAGCYYFYALNSFAMGMLSWDILLLTLVLMCVVPYHGDYFSLDALRRGEGQAYRKMRPFFLQRLLQIQVACTYFYTGLSKVTASGNWLTDNPLYYLLNVPPEGVTKNFLLRDFFAGHPGLCYALGILIAGIEIAMPVLLFNRRTRLSAIYLGILFHVTLILTLDVPAIFFFLFPAQLYLFIPPEKILRWVEDIRARNKKAGQALLVYDGHCRFCQRSVRTLEIMDLWGVLDVVDYQRCPDLGVLHADLNYKKAHSQLHLILPEGQLLGGFAVLRRLSLGLPLLYPLMPVFYAPGMGIAGPIIYRFVSRNRYLFHSNQVCQDNICSPS